MIEAKKKEIDLDEINELESCSLYRAVRWIAFNEKPIDEDIAPYVYPEIDNVYNLENNQGYYFFSQESVNWITKDSEQEYYEAVNLLRIQLIRGKVIATGIPLKNKKQKLENPYMDENSISPWYEVSDFNTPREAIINDFWKHTDLRIDTIINQAENNWFGLYDTDVTAYEDIEVNFQELKRCFSKKENIKPKSSYNPFYMQLICKIIDKFGITNNNQPPKQAILEWLQENHPNLSQRDKEALATFVRLPEMKKGGFYKGKP